MTFAENIKSQIDQQNLTIKKVSENLGIPYRTIQDWCAGRRTPKEYTQENIIVKIKQIKTL